MTALLQSLRAAVGDANVLVGDGLDAYEVDWRKRYPGKALAVVRPGDAGQVAAAVRACAAHGTAIVTQGGNTGLVGGSTPDGSGTQVVLSLNRMNLVRAVDVANASMTVDAGCVLQVAQHAADEQGLLLALSLAAEGSCTVGGNLATNAGGTQVLRYGNAREQCLGLEFVTADGAVCDLLGGLRKDNTGYDLRDLLIGSEGTLAVITGATLKLHPRPIATMTALVTLATMPAAVELLGLAQQRLGPALTGFEVMGAFALGLVARHFPRIRQPLEAAPWTALIELSDHDSTAHATYALEQLLEAAMDRGITTDAAVAASIEQSNQLWHLRETIPLAQALEGTNIKHDIALPVSCIAAFVESTDAALLRAFPGIRLVNFGHLGDGNLHYNVQCPEGIDAAEFLHRFEPAVNALVFDAVSANGGSISAEHGIGVQKREELTRRKSPVALQMMRSIKAALDPQGLFNPGRLL